MTISAPPLGQGSLTRPLTQPFISLYFILILGFLSLTGCSFPGVYKINIQQGNIVTEDMLSQLEPGMTPQQVRYVMGTPMLTDAFNSNQWIYLYSFKPGGKQAQQKKVSLFFSAEGRYSHYEGSLEPVTLTQ